MKEMHHSNNSIWDHFQTSPGESIKHNVPIKTTRKKDGCTWITSDIKRLIRKRHRWHKRSRKSVNSGDNEQFKDLKRSTQKEVRRAYWKYIDGIMSNETESELETGKRGNTTCTSIFFPSGFYWYIVFNAFPRASLKMIPDGINGMVHFLHGINGILYCFQIFLDIFPVYFFT
jgi:hypothetical protein